MPFGHAAYVWSRLGTWLRWGLIFGIFALTATAIGAFLTVEYTAQPTFCDNCHLMEPYYESWKHSAHGDVACIECHYEPGSLETLEGKFKALSQVAKYVTRTQGTKPWAEVSDYSCMRAGCHTVRELEGPIEYGRVKFDHAHHLLESRRGRRLRCTSCHSQVMTGEHISVTESVCFTCHFMPDDHGVVPEQQSDCLICHGPPKDPVDVGGRDFVHADYVARGVDCKECHDPVIEGEGKVRRERCHSCHGEAGHIERIDETAFLHEMHVTDHKVECFECHDEIHHGLLPLEQPRPASKEGCGACHVDTHDAVRSVYAGTGALGVQDRPSRMYETRVVCSACHTGRTDELPGLSNDPHGEGHDPHRMPVASAGKVDCIHCHGTGYEPMLAQWQGTVGGELERLGPMLAELEERAAESDEAAQVLVDARKNYELIAFDGSRGAHNPNYALDVLADVAQRLDRAAAVLDPSVDAPETAAAAHLPIRSGQRCDECHLGVESLEVEIHGTAFPHDAHLRDAGLSCAACHQTDPDRHGEPTFDRASCATCHHDDEAEAFDAYDCASCHAAQDALMTASLDGFPGHDTPMEEKTCDVCHGEPPTIWMPTSQMCELCHDEGFGEMVPQWQATVGGEIERLRPMLAQLLSANPAGDAHAAAAHARQALEDVAADPSRGAHNPSYALEVLASAAEQLDRGGAALDSPIDFGAAAGAPIRSGERCDQCHIGVGALDVEVHGRPFPHDRHLRSAGLSCADCHSTDPEQHGEPTFDRASCATCHHDDEAVTFDAEDCSSCHQVQTQMMEGGLPGVPEYATPMAEKECSECHGSVPDLIIPTAPLCELCHDEDYAPMLDEWRGGTDALLLKLEAELEAKADSASPEARASAREALRLIRADGSRGVHNHGLARELLQGALDGLDD